MSYGFCPTCGGPGLSRERRLNGNDRCGRGHVYPSKDALGSTGDYLAECNDKILYLRGPSPELIFEVKAVLRLCLVIVKKTRAQRERELIARIEQLIRLLGGGA